MSLETDFELTMTDGRQFGRWLCPTATGSSYRARARVCLRSGFGRKLLR